MIHFVLADLKRFRLGSAVIVLLIALAVALGTTVTLQERALRLGSARASEKFDLIVGAPGSATQLVLSSVFLQPAALPLMPGDTLVALTEDPRVAWAAPIGFGDFVAGFPVIGTTTTLIEMTTTGFAEGRAFAAEGEAVIGSAVDLALGDTLVPTHGKQAEGGHAHAGIAYRVTGRLDPTGTPWDRAVLVPIQAVWHVHGLGHEAHDGHDHEAEGHDEEAHDADGHDEEDHAHAHAAGEDHAESHAENHGDDHGDADHDDHDSHDAPAFDPDAPLDETWAAGEAPGLPAILVKPRSIADAYRLRQDYRATGDTLAVFPAEVLTGLYAMLGDAKRVLVAVAVGAQTLVAAALLLVTVIQVGQRRRQIGALRAFGTPRGAVFGIVWLELALLFGTGILLGLGLGFAATEGLSRAFAAERGFPLPVAFAPGDLLGFGLLVLGAAGLSAVPAWLAYRQPPAAALRD
ncbi:FtsX-like permease family protein [Rhodovulum visakhapatnamense]|uniref:Putative ABC transport system permease protein n=1 Tax=Rhodovulum visakhapatnamense TaxID=364297 RepID=A0A4R8FZJ4_9RHOB|nr:FtsX-like permease family protein [Rhodovulum visakhapatnamense]TDX32581.1 putative ABC transport system permease protein [Rhodovulum visakhapatnamense]